MLSGYYYCRLTHDYHDTLLRLGKKLNMTSPEVVMFLIDLYIADEWDRIEKSVDLEEQEKISY